MQPTLFATCLAAVIACAFQASAQSAFDFSAPPVGKEAGTLMVRLRAIGVIPLDSSSSISVIGGHVNATAQAAPEVDFSYFITDNVALELIAATTTTTGLTVECELDTNTYQKGIKVTAAEMATLNIERDAFHPEWNYTIAPRGASND